MKKKNKLKKFKLLLQTSSSFVKIFLLFDFILLVSIASYFFLSQERKLPLQREAIQLFKLCSSNWERCYAENFLRYTKSHKLSESLQLLDTIQILDSRTRGCHLIAHSIATSEVDKSPQNWQNVLSEVTIDQCTGGFIHGAVEAHTKYNTSFVLTAESMSSLCKVISAKVKKGEYRCFHILGHLLLTQEKGDVDNSIKVCSLLFDGIIRKNCYSGVFMENGTRENLAMHGVAPFIPWNKKTTAQHEDLCRRYEKDIAESCWKEISHMYTYNSDNYPPKVYELCKRAPTENAFIECYAYGVAFMVGSANLKNQNIKYLCKPLVNDKEKMKKCIEYAIGTLTTSSIHFVDRALLVCKNMPITYVSKCYAYIGESSRLAGYTQEEQRFVCNALPSEFQRECLANKKGILNT